MAVRFSVGVRFVTLGSAKSGIELSELRPHLSKVVDDITVVKPSPSG